MVRTTELCDFYWLKTVKGLVHYRYTGLLKHLLESACDAIFLKAGGAHENSVRDQIFVFAGIFLF